MIDELELPTPFIAGLSSCSGSCLVRMLKEELMLLQEPGSYVGEVVKVMGKSKVLVKVCRYSLGAILGPCVSYPCSVGVIC